MASLTPDEWKKMIDELTKAIPEPQTPMISAILYTNKDYLIPPSTMYQAEHENKTYFLMNGKDVQRVVNEVEKANPPSTITRYEYQVGLPSLVGIPVIEDTEKIQKIFTDAIKKYVEKIEGDLFSPQPRPFINCECGGLVVHAPGCKKGIA